MKSKEPRELVALEKAAAMLATAASFKDIKSIRDAALAAQVWVKAARQGLETQNRVAVIRIQAERKAGKWLSNLKLRGGDRRSEPKRQHPPLKLEDLGVTRDESKRWQREASVSERDFQKYVATSSRLGQEVSSAGLIRLASHQPSTNHRRTNGSSAARSNGKSTPSPAARAGPPTSRNVAVPRVQSNDSSRPRQLIVETENHLRLLASMLAPVCTNGSARFTPVERRHVKYLLLEIEKGLSTLDKLV